jgi:uncharacterized protein YjeT (DUF2065 family)
MGTILLILAGLMALESLLLVFLPDRIKMWIEDLSANELRTMGLMELLIVVVVVYYALSMP